MHESTVSRVTANKYIATPRGTFELKYFFTTAIPGTGGGETHSAEAVRHRIRAHGGRGGRRRRSCPTTRSWSGCARKAWTSPAGPWPNTGRRCGYPVRCSASGKRPSRPEPPRRRAGRTPRHAAAAGSPGGPSPRGRRRGHLMHITVAGKQVETGEALKTHVRDGLSAIAQQVLRPRARGQRHLPPRCQGTARRLHLRHQPEGRPQPVHARRGRGPGRAPRLRGGGRARRQAPAPLPAAGERPRPRPGARNGADAAETAPQYVVSAAEDEEDAAAARGRGVAARGRGGGGADGADHSVIVAEQPAEIARLTLERGGDAPGPGAGQPPCRSATAGRARSTWSTGGRTAASAGSTCRPDSGTAAGRRAGPAPARPGVRPTRPAVERAAGFRLGCFRNDAGGAWVLSNGPRGRSEPVAAGPPGRPGTPRGAIARRRMAALLPGLPAIAAATGCARFPALPEGPGDPIGGDPRFLEAMASAPVLPGNDVSLRFGGFRAFSALFRAIEAARDSVNLEFYIFKDVRLPAADGPSLFALLREKLREGVAVSVIYDSIGSAGTPTAALRRAAGGGGEAPLLQPRKPLGGARRLAAQRPRPPQDGGGGRPRGRDGRDQPRPCLREPLRPRRLGRSRRGHGRRLLDRRRHPRSRVRQCPLCSVSSSRPGRSRAAPNCRPGTGFLHRPPAAEPPCASWAARRRRIARVSTSPAWPPSRKRGTGSGSARGISSRRRRERLELARAAGRGVDVRLLLPG